MSAFTAAQKVLDSKNLGDFIDEKRTELFTVTKGATVADAMKVLEKLHVLSVPVVDEDGEYEGCISVGDLLRGLNKELETNLGEHWADNVAAVTAEQLNEIGAHFISRPIKGMIHSGDVWLRGDSKTNVMNVIVEGFAIKEKKAHHRIFVCDPTKSTRINLHDKTTVLNIEPGSEKADASAMRPTDVISQLDVVKLLQQHKAELGEVADTKIEDLHVFMGAAFTVPNTITALEAFHHMAADYKSCLGVVDADGKLVANLSLADIRALSSSSFDKLLMNVVDFINSVNNGPNMELLTPSSTFGQLLDTLVEKKRHRVYILDEVEKAISIITLTDILRAVAGFSEPAKAAPYPEVAQESSSDSDDE